MNIAYLISFLSEYISNVVYVDRLVEEVTEIINKYYHYDNKTAFIFTSDHGMTDWGRLFNLLDNHIFYCFILYLNKRLAWEWG